MEEEPVYEHDNGMEEDEQPKDSSKEEIKIDEDALKLAEARQNHANGRLGEAQSTVDSLSTQLKDLEDKVAAAVYFRRHFSRIHESKQRELDKVITDVKKAKEDIQHFSKQITVAIEDVNAIKQGLPPPSIVEVNERLKKRDRAGDYIQYDEDNDYIRNRRSRSPRSTRDDSRRRGPGSTTSPASTHDLHPMIESLFLNALDVCLEKQTMPFSIGEINLAMKELQPKWDMQKDTGLTRFYELVKLFESVGHLVSLKEARQVMIIDSRRIHGGKGCGNGGSGKRKSSREDDRSGGGGEDRSRRRVERGEDRGGERERRGVGDRERRGRREGGRNDDISGNMRKNDPPVGVVGREKGEDQQKQQQQQGRFPGRDDDDDDSRRHHESGGEGRFPESRWEPEDSVE